MIADRLPSIAPPIEGLKPSEKKPGKFTKKAKEQRQKIIRKAKESKPDPLLATGRAHEYAEQVIAGEIVVGEPVYRACLRFLVDCEDPRYYYDVEAEERVIAFAGILKHYKGPLAGQYFAPEPWQIFILGAIFALKVQETGLRKHHYAYIEIARKNGKTFLAAVVALYMLLLDGEGGAEIYSAATTRDQAKIVWEDTMAFIFQEEELLEIIKIRNLLIAHPDSNSTFKPLSSDAGTLDGLNPHCVVCDEVHAWKGRDLWDVIEDAFMARAQPLMFCITTAGTDKTGIGYQQRAHCIRVLGDQKDYIDEAYFAYIATLDEKDDPFVDEHCWIKANPNLGVSKILEKLRVQAQRAAKVPSKQVPFLIKQMDIWTTSEVRWLDLKLWRKGGAPIDESTLVGKYCYGGLDLSTNTDLTAVAYLFPPEQFEHNKFVLLLRYFMPEDNIQQRVDGDKVPYDLWRKAGHMIATPGNVVDTLFVKKTIVDDSKKFKLKELAYDPYKAITLTQELEALGIMTIEVRQSHASLGFPTSMLEQLVLEERLLHGGNPILEWNAENTVVILDANENIRPDKRKSTERIDGIAAAVNSIAVWCHYNVDYGEVKTV